MRTLVLRRLRLQPSRYVVIGLCVAVCSAFVVAALVLAQSLTATLGAAIAATWQEADAVVVSPASPGAPAGGAGAEHPGPVRGLVHGDARTIAGLDGVEAAWAPVLTPFATRPDSTVAPLAHVQDLPADPSLLPYGLVDGSLPDRPGEIALSAQLADGLGVGVGDAVPLHRFAEDSPGAQPDPVAEPVVSGVLDIGQAASGATAWALETDLAAWSPDEDLDAAAAADGVLVRLADGVSPADLTPAVERALGERGADVVVRTPEQVTAEALDGMAGSSNLLATFFLGFAGLALLVAFLVVTTTFSVLTAQRARELALLRCVGATGRQLRRAVLAEALAVGLLASAAGSLVLTGAALVAGRLLGDGVVVAVSPLAPLAGTVVGTVVTLLASLAPARRALRAAPLDGLRGSRVADRMPRARVACGLLLLVAGAAALTAGAALHAPLAAMGGAAAAGLGLVVSARLWVPALVRALGRLLPGGVASRLAAANAVRFPGRTTTTAAALLVGVALVATVLTGRVVAQRAILDDLDRTLPVDVTLAAPLTDTQLRAVADLADVLGTGPAEGAEDGAVVVDLRSGLGPAAAADAVEQLAGITGQDPAVIDTAASYKASFVQVLDILLAIALGLLGASVLVSVLGIASTMSLSVLERTRENSLLRALGLSRRGLGAVIRREALVIAAAATAVGLGAGWALGVGVVASLAPEGVPVPPVVPWSGFAAVVAGAVLTALLATLGPVRRARRISPAEGLAIVA